MFLLIFNKRVSKFTFVLVLTYYVNHSLIGATAFICNIDRDWMIYCSNQISFDIDA